jgi:hypothetical protein
MVKPKYAVGDRVIAIADTRNDNIRPGVYTIARYCPSREESVNTVPEMRQTRMSVCSTRICCGVSMSETRRRRL